MAVPMPVDLLCGLEVNQFYRLVFFTPLQFYKQDHLLAIVLTNCVRITFLVQADSLF